MSEAAKEIRRPSILLQLLESRAVPELGAYAWLYPLLHLAPRGDGHPVLVLPGFLTTGAATFPLRHFLKVLGYKGHRWKLGRNLGPVGYKELEILHRLKELRHRYARKVSIIGWSLGGLYARELAWMFYTHRIHLEDYKVVSLLPRESLDHWRSSLETIRNLVDGWGGRLLVVFVPSKPNVYTEKLPGSFYRLRETTRLGQLMKHLDEKSDIDVIYLKDAVVRAKSDRQVCHRYDTHWNQYGAFVGFRETVRHLKRHFPRLKVPAAGDYTFEETVALPNDLLGLQGIDSTSDPRYRETDWRIEPAGGRKYRVVREKKFPQPMNLGEFFEHSELDTSHPDATLPRLVMFHDSYGAQFIRYFAEKFSRASFRAQYAFDRKLVEREKPDIVILVVLDRHVNWAFPL